MAVKQISSSVALLRALHGLAALLRGDCALPDTVHMNDYVLTVSMINDENDKFCEEILSMKPSNAFCGTTMTSRKKLLPDMGLAMPPTEMRFIASMIISIH